MSENLWLLTFSGGIEMEHWVKTILCKGIRLQNKKRKRKKILRLIKHSKVQNVNNQWEEIN